MMRMRTFEMHVLCACALFLSIKCEGLLKTPKLKLESIYNNRYDLKCEPFCDSDHSCCVCFSYQKLDDVGPLIISYNDRVHTTYLTNSGQQYSFYNVHNLFGNMTEFPANICEFPTIVHIDLSFNKISDIAIISCVVYLDRLILRGNKIEYLSNQTFLNMKYIRIIDLSYNHLKYMEPGFLINMAGSLFDFDVSHNLLNSIDVTNTVWTKQNKFCRSDFSYNKIQYVTNELNWKSEDTTIFGRGGMIDFSNNHFMGFPDVTKLGFKNIRHLGKLIYYGFDLRNNPFVCDCHMYPFISLAPMVANYIKRSYFNVRCHSPLDLKNKFVLDLMHKDKMLLLICNISIADKCPPNCQCFYQPGIQNRTVINCLNSGITKMPAVLPDYSNLNINLANNKIDRFKPEQFVGSTFRFPLDYLTRTQVLNLSNNFIEELPRKLFHFFRNITLVDLTQNKISRVTRSLQHLTPCQIMLGIIFMDCSCQDVWLQQWLTSTRTACLNNTEIKCRVGDRFRSILELTEDDLGCRRPIPATLWIRWFILILFNFILITSAIVYKFKFEILILTRNFRKRFSRTYSQQTIIYDVYVSCDEDDESIRKWVLLVLAPYLEKQNVCMFLPFRDCVFGNSRGEEIIDIMSKSRNFVIILSEEYHGSVLWNQKEWKYAWHFYQTDLNREIVVVNYDMLQWNEVAKQYLGAFLRLHIFIDFSNLGHSIEKDIASMLQLNGTSI